jgi:hypothetical protein
MQRSSITALKVIHASHTCKHVNMKGSQCDFGRQLTCVIIRLPIYLYVHVNIQDNYTCSVPVELALYHTSDSPT